MKCVPVWPGGYHREMNVTVGLRCLADVEAPATIGLNVTSRNNYRLWIDGRFVGCGPARAAHGHVRLDTYDLPVDTGLHLVAIEVNAPNVPGYAHTDEHPLVQAELAVDSVVVAATGCDTLPQQWEALLPGERLQKVMRTSRQRGFVDAWRLSPTSSDWRLRADTTVETVPVDVVEAPTLLPRVVPYPGYDCVYPVRTVSGGVLDHCDAPQLHPWETWMRADTGKTFAGFPASEWEVDILSELAGSALRVVPGAQDTSPELAGNTWRMVDFGVNRTGFMQARLTCVEPAVVYIVGDELEEDGVCDCRRLEYLAGGRFELAPGNYELELAEVVTARYMAVLVLSGSVSIESLSLREYARTCETEFACSDDGLSQVFEAGMRSFAHNAVDIYLDCPSRERAGWLCDSFFSGRAEPWLTGGSLAETVFLDNYSRCPSFDYLPDGMLPKCYPADGPQMRGGQATYLPTWALWLVLQVEEYARRDGDADLVDSFRQRIVDLFAFFEQFRNEDGLLEKLESWVFVDWSEANQHVRDVSYPVNLLYAAVLDAAGRLYGEDAWCERAAEVRRTVLAQSWDGSAFVDNACRDESGRLVATSVHTEACQYYAFYFGIATPTSHPELWNELLTECSAAPGVENPRFLRAGLFPSLHMRLLLLARYAEHQQLATEIRDAFLPMAELTGTLWEHEHALNSCNHGYTSHVVHLLLRHILGLTVDRRARTLRLSVPKLDLAWCRARIPIDGELVEVGWHREGEQVIPTIDRLPAGWKEVSV